MITFIKKLLECLKDQNSTKEEEVSKPKVYTPKFLDDSYANEYSLLRFEEQGYFNFKKYFKGYYDDDDIKVTVLFPDLVKELIDSVGIKSKVKTKLYYELDNYELTLNNDFKVKLYKLKENKFSSMLVDSTDAVFIAGVSSNDGTVEFLTKEIKNTHRSNSYSMNFVSEQNLEFCIEQTGIFYIYEAINKFKNIKALK